MTVYFLRDKECGSIKIGYTDGEPKLRISSIQVSSPHELEVMALADGGLELEAELHVRLAAYRIRGEWFRPEPEVLAVIAATSTPICHFCNEPRRRVHGTLAHRICAQCASAALIGLSEALTYKQWRERQEAEAREWKKG